MTILTKGGNLVDRLVQAAINHVEKPKDSDNFQSLASARTALEKHLKFLEIRAGEYKQMQGGRPAKGVPSLKLKETG